MYQDWRGAQITSGSGGSGPGGGRGGDIGSNNHFSTTLKDSYNDNSVRVHGPTEDEDDEDGSSIDSGSETESEVEEDRKAMRSNIDGENLEEQKALLDKGAAHVAQAYDNHRTNLAQEGVLTPQPNTIDSVEDPVVEQTNDSPADGLTEKDTDTKTSGWRERLKTRTRNFKFSWTWRPFKSSRRGDSSA